MTILVALVGTKHRGADMVALLASLPDGEPLMLIRDPFNPFDPMAVQVWARGKHVGFVKGNQCGPLAMAMDAAAQQLGLPAKGATKLAKLSVKEGKPQPMVDVE